MCVVCLRERVCCVFERGRRCVRLRKILKCVRECVSIRVGEFERACLIGQSTCACESAWL